jgi:uncharacterized damage-inducible protein DinB
MNNPALNSLKTIYDESVDSIIEVIHDLSITQLRTIVDKETENEDTRSIQSILSHILHSGDRYIKYISDHFNLEYDMNEKIALASVQEYKLALARLKLNFERFVMQFKDSDLDKDERIVTSWNQPYNIEQLIEHAIVHNLRHLLQIKKYKKELSQ